MTGRTVAPRSSASSLVALATQLTGGRPDPDAGLLSGTAARAGDPADSEAAPSASGADFGGDSGAGAASNWLSMHATNCWSSLSDTSCITPRPNWAGLPVMARSVVTSARVVSPSAVSWIVT